MPFAVEVVTDSIAERSPRLTTFRLRYPKFIHGEFMTHRTFSRNASSSRAIPVSKNLEEVRSDELRACPVYWGAEQKGMASGEELDDETYSLPWRTTYDDRRLRDREVLSLDGKGILTTPRYGAQFVWKRAALAAATEADHLHRIGAHKSIVNRVLEPFLHINVVMTSCEPGLMNFFGLRLDKAAQPEIRVLAEMMWKVWNESTPRRLEPGPKHTAWHLPFVSEDDASDLNRWVDDEHCHLRFMAKSYVEAAICVSVSRCARVSYTSFETGRRSTVEEDLTLYDRLVGSQPLHASPAEHQATPDHQIAVDIRTNRLVSQHDFETMPSANLDVGWAQPKQHGNLPGWRQYRKMLVGEAVAPLPEAYR